MDKCPACRSIMLFRSYNATQHTHMQAVVLATIINHNYN